MNDKPMITRASLLGMQVCVPKHWTDEQVRDYANTEKPTGIESQWSIRRQGDEALRGCDERVQCEERPDCCHIMLDC